MSRSKNDFASIGDLYGGMLNGIKSQLVAEGKLGPAVKTAKTNPTVKPGEIGDVALAPDRGPRTTAGYLPAKVDKKTMSKKDIDDNLYKIDDLSYDEDEETKKKTKKAALKKANVVKAKKMSDEDEEELVKESGKIAKERLNNFMRRKSIFDKLYENVMQPDGRPEGGEMDDSQELDALGIDGEGDELGGGEDEVTFTLDRATAEKLLDVIGAAMGQGHDEGEGENEFGGEEEGHEGDEDEEGFWDEDEEELGGAKDLSKEVNFGKNNKVSNLKVQNQYVTGSYTDKTGVSDEYGHSLVNAKQVDMGKDIKVKSVLKNAGGKKMFEI